MTCRLVLITDQKPGHKAQLEGFLSALQGVVDVEALWVDITRSPLDTVKSICQCDTGSIVIGAGRKTSKYLFLAKTLLRNIKTVHLMRPGIWPLWLFDFVVAPYHDNLGPSKRVICTEGAINSIAIAKSPDPNKILILIGGPSKHYEFDQALLIKDLEFLIKDGENKEFLLTTSRRTPPGFLPALRQLKARNLSYIAAEETGLGWVAKNLQIHGAAWVTEDSVSMLYEALTAGIRVGILPAPKKKLGRVVSGVKRLVEQKKVTPFGVYIKQRDYYPAVEPVREAEKVIRLLQERNIFKGSAV